MYSNHKHPTTHSLDDDLLGRLALSLRVFVRQELYLRRQRRCKPRALWVSQHARLEVLPDSFDALAQSDINIKFFNNQIKPDVNAQVTYGAAGIAGTQAIGGRDPLTGVVTPIEFVARSYGSALGDAFSNAYPQWAFGVHIGYPLGANTATPSRNVSRVSRCTSISALYRLSSESRSVTFS